MFQTDCNNLGVKYNVVHRLPWMLACRPWSIPQIQQVWPLIPFDVLSLRSNIGKMACWPRLSFKLVRFLGNAVGVSKRENIH